MPFPAKGLALGQGVARRAARRWARARGPEDGSVRAPLPSTGQRCRSCSAAGGRFLAGTGAPHPGGPRRPEVAMPSAASRHLGPRLSTRPRAPAPTCFLPLLLVKAELRTAGEAPCRPQEPLLTQLWLLVSSARPGVTCVL